MTPSSRSTTRSSAGPRRTRSRPRALRKGRLNDFFHDLLPAGLRDRPYRFWYFVVVTVAVLAGFWMVLQTSPFIIWLAGSVFFLINQGIGCIQIMLINNRRLHPEFHVGKVNMVLLPLATAARWAAVAIWLYAGGLAEIIRRWQAGRLRSLSEKPG